MGVVRVLRKHHRCGWRAYVGKAAWRSWGLTPEQFEVVSWMTGKWRNTATAACIKMPTWSAWYA